MRLNQVLAGVIGACLMGMPAKASRLQDWQFDVSQNRLTFTTEGDVQPQAQLLHHPTRLVVDLPGVVVDQPIANQLVGGAVKEVRVGQYDAETTRLVIELNPDYEITPDQIRLWGITPHQWVVQLPDMAGGIAVTTSPLPPALKTAQPADPPPKPSPVRLPEFLPPSAQFVPAHKQTTAYAAAATQLQSILTTDNGFFIQTGGTPPQVQVYRVRDRTQARQVVLDVVNAQIGAALASQVLPSQRFGVRTWSIAQFNTSPPAVRITLTLEDNAPDWQVAPIQQGGIVLLPVGSPSNFTIPQTPIVQPVSTPPPTTRPTPAQPPVAQPVAQISRVATPAMMTPAVPQGQFVVVLDPGHGGRDSGAVGIGGLQEKQVVTAITQQVAAILGSQGVSVVLTRQGDQTVDLQPRVDMAERANATVFVSIHANAISMDRPEVNGFETYYHSAIGERLARVLHNRVMGTLAMNDRGVRQANFYVIRRTSMPAVLVETGFVTGAVDAPRLRDPNWQAQMAQAIAAGILDYLRQGP